MTIVLRPESAPSAPLASISVRRYPRGAGLHDAAKLKPPNLLQGATKLLIFIHGYNNTQLQAERSYGVFQARLTKLKGYARAGFYWPGDNMRRQAIEVTPPPTWRTWLSAIYYDRQVGNAVRSGRLLADRVRAEIDHRRARIERKQPSSPFEIYIVAHSLGCRVALEFLQRLSVLHKADVRFPLVVLMAAAVPQAEVGSEADLRDGLLAAADVLIYSSDDDHALGIVFRIGQFGHRKLRDLFSRNHSALGSTGVEPAPRVHRRHEAKRGHGDYWPAEGIALEVQESIIQGHVPPDPSRRFSNLDYYARLI
jgi:hypothetical protein